jgi:hypothetical protein
MEYTVVYYKRQDFWYISINGRETIYNENREWVTFDTEDAAERYLLNMPEIGCRMTESNVTAVKQYWYEKDDKNGKALSEAVLASLDRFVEKYKVPLSQIKVFVVKDEVTEDDDFGNLNVELLSKGLPKRNYQIGPVPRREPTRFEGKRIPYE